MLMFSVQFIYLLFITLPFDINDAETDKLSNVKTIPSVFGIKTSKIITLMLGIIYFFSILFMFMLVNWNHLPNKYLSDSTIILIWVLLVLLQIFTFLKSDKVSKWWIKIIYDGSMILYFLFILITK
jgi:4-hydroxybenzoate polyprenyltransferase